MRSSGTIILSLLIGWVVFARPPTPTGLRRACGATAQHLPVELKRGGNRMDVSIGGKAFGAYYFGPEAPKPFFYPLRSARGTIVTRGYPMVKDIPGESHDHPHHRARRT